MLTDVAYKLLLGGKKCSDSIKSTQPVVCPQAQTQISRLKKSGFIAKELVGLKRDKKGWNLQEFVGEKGH